MSRCVVLFLGLFLLALQCGCVGYNTRYLAADIPPGEVEDLDLLMRDGTIYKLDWAWVSTDVIRGRGWKFVDDDCGQEFQGEIPCAEVALGQVHHRDFLSGLITATALIMTVAVVADDGDPEGGYAYVSSPYSGGWGSCPFVYAYDGAAYRLEAEPFAGSVCRPLERTSHSVLHDLVPVEGTLKLALCNQAQETHLVNRIALQAVTHPEGTDLLPDPLGRLHVVSDPVPPSGAYDRRGQAVVAAVAEADGRWWQSDLDKVDLRQPATMTDEVVCRFARPAGADAGRLVLRLVNSSLGEYAVLKLISWCGPSLLDWYHDLETDPVQRLRLQAWVSGLGGLRVQIRRGARWESAGMISHVGGVAPVSMALPLNLSGVKGDSLVVRLQGTAGLWRIDRVAVDFGPEPAYSALDLDLLSLESNRGQAAPADLAADDEAYLQLLEGDWATLHYAAFEAAEGKVSYVLSAGGHYYKWPLDPGRLDRRDLVARALSDPVFCFQNIMVDWLAEPRWVQPPPVPEFPLRSEIP